MANKGTSKRQKRFSNGKLKSFDVYDKRLANKKVVHAVLLEALLTGDLETFREVLTAHLRTVSKLKLSQDSGIGRQTLYDLLDETKNFDPKLSTVSAILKSFTVDLAPVDHDEFMESTNKALKKHMHTIDKLK